PAQQQTMGFDEQLQRVFDALADRVRNELTRELERARAELTTHARADREPAFEKAETDADRALDLAASERLVDAIRVLDRAATLTEILDALATCAGREAPRAAVFLVRHGELRGWRFIGFGAAFDVASATVMPLSAGGLMAEAVQTGASISSD